MIHIEKFKPEQFEKAFQTGEQTFDIPPKYLHSSVEPEMILAQCIDRFEASNIVSFLNYQYEHSEYGYFFLGLTAVATNTPWHKLPDTKSKICFNWLIQKVDLDEIYFKKALGFFFGIAKYNQAKMEEWYRVLSDYLEDWNSEEAISFLGFGMNLLQQAYNLHKICCTAPLNCHTNKMFEYKVHKTNRLIDTIKSSNTNDNTQKLDKVEWLGTQKELGELLIELQKKGWINKPKYATIKAAFTNSNSIQQVMKPNQDKKTKEKTFSDIYTTDYIPKFHLIQENPKNSTS